MTSSAWFGTAIVVLAFALWVWSDFAARNRFEARQKEFSDQADRIRARQDYERSLWHPLFRYGCHEYEQHEDGRRRAVRIVDGADVLMTEWLQVGANVPSYLAKVGQ